MGALQARFVLEKETLMTEPISRKEFQKANEAMVKSIKGHIDEKFTAHEKLEAVRHGAIDKVLTKHDTTLYGEPGDEKAVGLRIKVDRLNTWAKAISTAIVGAVTAGASYLGFK